MNFAKMALKTAALVLSATVLLTACGKSEEPNDDQPSDASAAVSDTASSVPASSDAASSDTTSEFLDNLTSDDEIKIKSICLGGSRYGAGATNAIIMEDGSLYMWGAFDFGQLGDGQEGDERAGVGQYTKVPVKVMDHVVSVSLGSARTAAITEDGSLYMWGCNFYGMLGDGTEENRSRPVKIMENVKAVSLGGNHSAAITEDGSLYMWGENKQGLLGNGTEEEIHVPTKIMDHVKAVSLGWYHSAAITEDGSLYLWGSNNDGQLGNGEKGDKAYKTTPIKIMDHVVSVSLGEEHTAAITEDGSLYLWGDNWQGQLGNGEKGNEAYKTTPIKIMDHVKSISLAGYCSSAITEDGSLYLWGRNSNGQLGNGEELDSDGFSSVPIKIMDGVEMFSLAVDSSGALKDGDLYLWGYNYYRQLEQGAMESTTPLKIDLELLFKK